MGCQMLVRPHEDVGRNMALGEFETDDLRHFLAAVRDGDIVFDIGANTGQGTTMLSGSMVLDIQTGSFSAPQGG